MRPFVKKGVRGESNSHLLVHSQPCSNRYTTDTIRFVASTPTRTRTRNTSLEARDDVRFTIGAQAEGKGVEPSSPRGRTALAPRPGQPYPATFRMLVTSVDPRGVEPRSPPRQGGVVPLDHRPDLSFQWTGWELNPPHRSCKDQSPPRNMPAHDCLSRGPSGNRTRSSSLPRKCAAETPTDRQVIPGGVEPPLSWLLPRRLRRWTTGSRK